MYNCRLEARCRAGSGLCCAGPRRTSCSTILGMRTGSLTVRGHLGRELGSRWKRSHHRAQSCFCLQLGCAAFIFWNKVNYKLVKSCWTCKLTSEERLPAAAGLHTQPRSLWCRHGPSEAGNECRAGVQVPTDPVLSVNDGRLRRSTAHDCWGYYSRYHWENTETGLRMSEKGRTGDLNHPLLHMTSERKVYVLCGLCLFHSTCASRGVCFLPGGDEMDKSVLIS